jgi:proline iminopeptidase
MRRLDDPFHPFVPPRGSGRLEVGDGHQMAWQDSGHACGLPMLSIHGGPGGSMIQGLSRFCDLGRLRLIQFDQRGCGASLPRGELHANTLAHTLGDIEALRRHFGIERWIVSGGSWGSTVALAYAQAFPERCLGLFVTGTWLARAKDFDWWFQGVRTLFPELWQAFAEPVPPQERHDLRRAYCARILDGSTEVAEAFATRLYRYEEGFMHFDAPLQPPDASRGAAYGRIFAHYARHDFFLREDQLLDDAGRITEVPLMQITGRWDACTPPDNAFDLAQRLPHSRLRIVAGAGHYPTEPAMARVLPGAIAEFIDWVQARASAA